MMNGPISLAPAPLLLLLPLLRNLVQLARPRPAESIRVPKGELQGRNHRYGKRTTERLPSDRPPPPTLRKQERFMDGGPRRIVGKFGFGTLKHGESRKHGRREFKMEDLSHRMLSILHKLFPCTTLDCCVKQQMVCYSCRWDLKGVYFHFRCKILCSHSF